MPYLLRAIRLFLQQPIRYITNYNSFVTVFRVSGPGNDHLGISVPKFLSDTIFQHKHHIHDGEVQYRLYSHILFHNPCFCFREQHNECRYRINRISQNFPDTFSPNVITLNIIKNKGIAHFRKIKYFHFLKVIPKLAKVPFKNIQIKQHFS